MLLPYTFAMDFIQDYTAVLMEIFTSSGFKETNNFISDLANARDQINIHPNALTEAVTTLKSRDHLINSEVEAAILSIQIDQWIMLRQTSQYALLLDSNLNNAYATKALTTPINEVVNGKSISFKAGLFVYKGHFVCDGIISKPVHLGPNVLRDFNDAYIQLKKQGKFHKIPKEYV